MKKCTIVGGGPGGLHTALMLRLARPDLEVEVLERRAEGDLPGFGITLPDELHGLLLRWDVEGRLAPAPRWDTAEVRVDGHHSRWPVGALRGVRRADLVRALANRAREAGVRLTYDTPVQDAGRIDADVVVGADGTGSMVRHAADFGTTITVAPMRYAWMGLGRRVDGLVFAFRSLDRGVARASAYPYSADESSLIVEVPDESADPRALFPELIGETVCTPAVYRPYVVVRTQTRIHGRYALVGDAGHSLYYSVGAGTPMALRQGFLLAQALATAPDVATALARYEGQAERWVRDTQEEAERDRVRLQTLQSPLDPHQFPRQFMARWD